MTKTKTPAPRRAGTSKTKRMRAEKLARKAMRDLGDDPEALAMIVTMTQLLASYRRRR